MSNKHKLEVVAIESDAAYMDNVVAVDNVSVTYVQEHDCCQSEKTGQQLTLSTHNNGTARFIALETERWSISDQQEIITIIKDFCKRAAMR